jgi:ribA/ribD-fused uncharacterized protein
MSEKILFYEGIHYMFSNFSSFAVEWKGVLWMTSEHAYQAAKFDDENIVNEIKHARSAHDSKVIARKYKEKVRQTWDTEKCIVMEDIVRAKLHQHEYIKRKLLESGDREIVEASPEDSFWGWGPDKQGENHLGKIWMKLREEIKS